MNNKTADQFYCGIWIGLVFIAANTRVSDWLMGPQIFVVCLAMGRAVVLWKRS